MREIGVRVAHSQHYRGFARVVERLHFAHCRVEAKRIAAENGRITCRVLELRISKGKRRPQRKVPRIAERDNRVQSVAAASHLDDQENTPIHSGNLLSLRKAAHPHPGHNKTNTHRSRPALNELSSADRHTSPPNSTETPAST